MGGVDLEVDGLAVNALVGTGNTGRLVLNLALNIGKVCKASVGNVVEFGPFGAAGGRGRAVGQRRRVGHSIVIGDVDELEDEGTTGDNAGATRQKVSADNVFENGRFTGRLGTDDNLCDEVC